jgi:GalNAc5-diNAcBac-PP-undecaprenol beta-1,3-glucosyltransferase
MTLRATVVVPTFDHGPTLLRSVPTALAQTVEEIEVLVVGDGAPEATRQIVAELALADPRVRFFDNPKGEGNGELHRHAALEEARGRVVAYLSDDDLWLPEHLEVLESLLEDADFASTYPIRLDPDGSVADWNLDLALPWYREAMLEGTNFVPLSCAGHTLGLYRRLSHGWRPRPKGVWSDLYMWQQILSVPGVVARSGTIPTVVHLPSSVRKGWTARRRLEELDRWTERIGDREWREELYRGVLARTARGQAENWQALQDHRAVLDGLRAHLEGLERAASEHRRHAEGLEARVDRLDRERREERAALEARVAELGHRLEGRERELVDLRATRTWRLRGRLLRLPVVGRVLRSAGRARRRSGGP